MLIDQAHCGFFLFWTGSSRRAKVKGDSCARKKRVILDMQVNGIVVITDMKDFSLSQFQWLLTHPGALKERITSIQDGVPMRIKVF